MSAPERPPTPYPTLRDLLPDDAGAIDELLTAAASDPAVLRDQPRRAVAVARADVVPMLVRSFTPEPGRGKLGWLADETLSGPVGSDAVCVTWSFAGRYSEERRRADGDVVEVAVGENRSFNGLQAVGQQIEVHGVTFVRLTEEPRPDLELRRYIDWAGLYTQLGLTLGWRPAHEVEARTTPPAGATATATDQPA